MKYTLDLPSPDYDMLIKQLQLRLITLSEHYYDSACTLGRAHRQTSQAAKAIASVEKAIRALETARENAMPEHAIENKLLVRAGANLQSGDELPLVYGRPRNDPRNPKRVLY